MKVEKIRQMPRFITHPWHQLTRDELCIGLESLRCVSAAPESSQRCSKHCIMNCSLDPPEAIAERRLLRCGSPVLQRSVLNFNTLPVYGLCGFCHIVVMGAARYTKHKSCPCNVGKGTVKHVKHLIKRLEIYLNCFRPSMRSIGVPLLEDFYEELCNFNWTRWESLDYKTRLNGGVTVNRFRAIAARAYDYLDDRYLKIYEAIALARANNDPMPTIHEALIR